MAFRAEISRRALILGGAAVFGQEIKSRRKNRWNLSVRWIGMSGKKPGKCPRCGMKLVAGLPDAIEYHIDIAASPKRIQAGKPVRLTSR